MKLLQRIGNLLFPPKCILCREILASEEMDLCHDCRKEISDFPKPKRSIPFLASWTALWYYNEKVRGSLLRFKFSGYRNYADAYGRMLAMKLQQHHPQGFDVLTWIPISPQRKLRRGYDQVELLARAVGRELDMEPVQTLTKIRNNPPQSHISGHAQRRANVLGAYAAKMPERFQGKRVLLLDDIITSGATAGEAARILTIAGAAEVHFAAVAASDNEQKKKPNSR